MKRAHLSAEIDYLLTKSKSVYTTVKLGECANRTQCGEYSGSDEYNAAPAFAAESWTTCVP